MSDYKPLAVIPVAHGGTTYNVFVSKSLSANVPGDVADDQMLRGMLSLRLDIPDLDEKLSPATASADNAIRLAVVNKVKSGLMSAVEEIDPKIHYYDSYNANTVDFGIDIATGVEMRRMLEDEQLRLRQIAENVQDNMPSKGRDFTEISSISSKSIVSSQTHDFYQTKIKPQLPAILAARFPAPQVDEAAVASAWETLKNESEYTTKGERNTLFTSSDSNAVQAVARRLFEATKEATRPVIMGVRPNMEGHPATDILLISGELKQAMKGEMPSPPPATALLTALPELHAAGKAHGSKLEL
jgi:hypothetical protein